MMLLWNVLFLPQKAQRDKDVPRGTCHKRYKEIMMLLWNVLFLPQKAQRDKDVPQGICHKRHKEKSST